MTVAADTGQLTYLTDAVLITAVVQAGRADALLKAMREVGASGGLVHHARGTGARERFGLLAIAVEAEKEVLTVVAAVEHQELITRTLYRAGELHTPGAGYLYVTPLDRLATHVPQESLDRLGAKR
jgi:nitrogen regulatory protein PII